MKEIVYKVLNKVIAADITQVLLLPTDAINQVENTSTSTCRFISQSELQEYQQSGLFSINQSLVDDFTNNHLAAMVSFIDTTPVGICFFAKGEVHGRHNSGGKRFKGIGLQLPDAVYYLFKVEVNHEHRGKRLFPDMLQTARQQLSTRHQSHCTIITTTDWTNHAFLKSSERLGFLPVGHAMELIIQKHHFCFFPGPIPIYGNKPGSNSSFIRFVKH